jgi:hypothetical protein
MRRKSNTFQRKKVEYNSEKFNIVELSTSEMQALARYVEENESNDVVAAAWIVSHGCEDFLRDNPGDLAATVGPGCLAFLSKQIMTLSGLSEEAQEETEKKSESDQS